MGIDDGKEIGVLAALSFNFNGDYETIDRYLTAALKDIRKQSV